MGPKSLEVNPCNLRVTSHTRLRARDQLHFERSRWWKRRSRSKWFTPAQVYLRVCSHGSQVTWGQSVQSHGHFTHEIESSWPNTLRAITLVEKVEPVQVTHPRLVLSQGMFTSVPSHLRSIRAISRSLHTWDWEPVTNYTSSALIGGKGGAGPSSIFTLRLRDHWSRWMQDGCKVLHGFLHGIEWIVFHGHWDCLQKPPLGGRPNTKIEDHGTPNAHNWLICSILSYVRTRMNRNSLK